MKASIVIVNYNSADDTLECLDSLSKIDYPDYEIILADNASSDASFVLNKIHKNFPAVKILALPSNLGFAGSNNAGIKAALDGGARCVLLLNNDTTVAPDFLSQMVKAAESDKKIGIVGAKIYYFAEKNRIWYNGGVFSWINGGRPIQDGAIDENPGDKEIRNTKYVTGCALLIKKEAVEKIGLLCENFFMYYEDIEWSLRIRGAGYKTVVAPAAHIWHKVSRSALKMGAPVIHYYNIRNALILTRMRASAPAKALVYLWSAYHYAKQIIKLIMFRDRDSKHIARAIMRGISDFYRGKYGKIDSKDLLLDNFSSRNEVILSEKSED